MIDSAGLLSAQPAVDALQVQPSSHHVRVMFQHIQKVRYIEQSAVTCSQGVMSMFIFILLTCKVNMVQLLKGFELRGACIRDLW